MSETSSRRFKDAARYRVLKTFREFDADGNGEISKEELAEALAKIGVSAAAAAEVVTRIDANQDGTVSYNEFVSWVFGSAGTDLPSGTEQALWAKDALREVFKAARRGNPDQVEKLLQRDSLVTANATEPDGCTLLMAAAQHGQMDVLRRLLELNCTLLNAVDDGGLTALDHARANGNPGLLDYMVNQHTSRNNTVVPFIGSLLPALERGDAEAVRESVRPRVVFKIYIDRHEGDLMGVDYLPAGGNALSVKEVHPAGLIANWNAKRGDLQVQPGDHIVQVNQVSGGWDDLKKELVKYQEMEITVHRYSPDEGFDPNMRDGKGATALHLAVRSGKLALVQALASSNELNVNEKDRYGRTALDIAKDHNYEDIYNFLGHRCALLASDMKTPSGGIKRIALTTGGY